MTSTRDALLSSAGELFYEEGITATGVDSVVRHAGLTKPTLYAHFGSKTLLVAAVLRRRYEDRRAELEAVLDPLPAADHPVAVVDWVGRFSTGPGHRGCGFLNAAAELGDHDTEAREVIQAEKDWLRTVLAAGCAAAGCRRPEMVGSQLLLLIDGLAGRAVVGGRPAAGAAAAEARGAALVLIAADR